MNLTEFLALAAKGRRVSVSQEFAVPGLLPMAAFQCVRVDHPEAVMLESLQEGNSRYSFIAFEPFASLRAEKSLVTTCIQQEVVTQNIKPFEALRQMIKNLSCVAAPHKDFIGSIIGFMSYGAVRLFEAIPDRHESAGLPDVAFNFYGITLRFDQQAQRLLISVIVEISDAPADDFYAAEAKMKALMVQLQAAVFAEPVFSKNILDIAEPDTDMDDAAFQAMVEKARAYIRAGDIFQVVVSRAFKVPYAVHPLRIYEALRASSPAPYMFYLPIDDVVVLGASPEKLVSVHEGMITTHPIAGTRRRPDAHHNQAIEADLLSDEKELAEHRMLVDLARNDVGAVATPGSVEVTELLKVKHYAHVSHITSTVIGQLRPECDALDALAAAFPAGTLSGAPKIRAMEIIDKLEVSSRGLYGGAICRLDYQGNLDSCIAIRMAILKNGMALIRAGAGIVFDSDAQAECDETRHKAHAMLYALALAQGVVS